MKQWKQLKPISFNKLTTRQQILRQLISLKEPTAKPVRPLLNNFTQRKRDYLKLIPSERTNYLQECVQLVADKKIPLDWYSKGDFFQLYLEHIRSQELQQYNREYAPSLYELIKSMSDTNLSMEEIASLIRIIFELPQETQSYAITKIQQDIGQHGRTFLTLFILLLPSLKNIEQLENRLLHFLEHIVPIFQQLNKPQKIKIELLKMWFRIWDQYIPTNYLNSVSNGMTVNNEKAAVARLLKYVPTFMLLTADRCNEEELQLIHHLATGKNIRKRTPYHRMSKKMAHLFVNLPAKASSYSDKRYSYCYLHALGIKHSGVIKILLNYLPAGSCSHQLMDKLDKKHLFLSKLSHWLRPDLLEPEDYPTLHRLLAYVQHCEDESIPFSWKGRTFKSTMRLVREWEAINIQKQQAFTQWEGANYSAWEGTLYYTNYRIIQLTNSTALHFEGISLHHCVGGYSSKCANGQASIWSLQKLINEDEWKSLITIEVSNSKRIIQAKGKFNSAPDPLHQQFIQQWVATNKLSWNTGNYGYRTPVGVYNNPYYDEEAYYTYDLFPLNDDYQDQQEEEANIEDLFNDFCYGDEQYWDKKTIQKEYFHCC